MCTVSCIEFGRRQLKREDVRGKSVIEVGAMDVNGSLRSYVEGMGSAAYLGVDIETGPGVDQVCEAERLVQKFGENSFDVLISTELLEHVKDWRKVVSNMKRALRPGGVLLITTRSKGFPYHAYPFDFWRYEIADMRLIFSDFMIETLENDDVSPGVFLRAKKPLNFVEKEMAGYPLYSIIKNKHSRKITSFDVAFFKIHRWLCDFVFTRLPEKFPIVTKTPESLKNMIKKLLKKE